MGVVTTGPANTCPAPRPQGAAGRRRDIPEDYFSSGRNRGRRQPVWCIASTQHRVALALHEFAAVPGSVRPGAGRESGPVTAEAQGMTTRIGPGGACDGCSALPCPTSHSTSAHSGQSDPGPGSGCLRVKQDAPNSPNPNLSTRSSLHQIPTGRADAEVAGNHRISPLAG